MDKETNISQIYKYLNGDLDAKAMHQMEKRALDDPFLMDALEGYEGGGKNQREQLEEIGERLKKRISGNEKRIVPWRYFAVAASVLVVTTIGGMWLFNQKNAKPQLAKVVSSTIQKEASPQSKEPMVNNDITIAKPNQSAKVSNGLSRQHNNVNYAAKSASAPPVAPVAQPIAVVEPTGMAADETADKAEKDTTPLNEMIVTEYTSGKKKDISQNLVSMNLMKVKKADTVPQQMLQGQVKGVEDNNVSAQPKAYGYNLPYGGSAQALKETAILHKGNELSKSVVKGQTVSANKARKMAPNIDDSAKTSSDTKGNSLAEVAVAAPVAIETTGIREAHPQKGWENLKKYLNKNAISPDKKTGKVVVSFLVDQNGVISNLQVVSGLSDATNQKAIYLISNGPAWIGNVNGIPEKVTVKIQFNK